MIIQRPGLVGRINEIKKWILIYGRRKTGKSFVTENFIHFDDYFFVKRDRSILSKKDNKILSYETFIEIIERELANNKTIVIDEFHRLGDDFFDFLHSTKKHGKLILISSTLFLSKKLISSRSPLLGFFAEIPVWLIDLNDCISELKKLNIGKKSLVETSILLKEPIAIDYFEKRDSPRKVFEKVVIGSIRTIPALVGEIFIEEERTVSAIYEGVLRAIANGNVISSEISSYLFSRKLISKDDPSIIQQYLTNLIEFGIIKRIKVYGKNRFIYKHMSPLARLFYYADEKYNISEKRPNEAVIKRIIDELMPRMVEDNVREFVAHKLGLDETVVEACDYDVDAYLLKFKKPKIAMEIKWKKVTKADIKKAEKNMEKIDAEEKMLFVPDKKEMRYKTRLKVVDISDFL